MPNWNKILTEVEASNQVNALDRMRKEYFEIIHRETGRNVISYYSGWLKQPTVHTMIDELDKNAFMSITHSLDKGMGLDIIIHTPGGDLAVMENLINYLHKIFNGDIRVIIPQIAMSAGTMIALFSKAILMGEQSCLGPVDPQYNGVACQAIIDEFEKAKEIFDNARDLDVCVLVFTLDCCYIFHADEDEIQRKIAQKAKFEVIDDFDISFLKVFSSLFFVNPSSS